MKGNIRRRNFIRKKERYKDVVFERICREKFRFLEDQFGCKVSCESDRYGTYVTYQNLTTAIRIALEPREGGVFSCRLIRLIDGTIPPVPIFIKPDTPLHGFYVEYLLDLRASSCKRYRPTIEELYKPTTYKKILTQYAYAVKRYAIDILCGDFRIFDELEKVVKKRAEESREERIKEESEQPKEGKHEETN